MYPVVTGSVQTRSAAAAAFSDASVSILIPTVG